MRNKQPDVIIRTASGGKKIDEEHLSQLLLKVQSGQVTVEEALAKLRVLPYEDLGFAKLDHHRALRKGFPEVIFGQGKTVEQMVALVERLSAQSDRVLVTRVAQECFAAVQEKVPQATYQPTARAIVIDKLKKTPTHTGVLVVSGGTADLPVAEEAALTAELMGNAVDRIYDVGVSGLHRLLDHLPRLHQAKVIVAVAGMEGALPSIISGLVAAPVIAVPTSVGYGASFGGLAPLLAMLNSCAPGVSVVNIDNGFGAGYLAALINKPRKEI